MSDNNQSCQVPLAERLRQCPVTNIGIKQGAAWHNIPVEALLEEAADALTAARADVARLTGDVNALLGALKFPERDNSFKLYMLQRKVLEWAGLCQHKALANPAIAEATAAEMREFAHD